MPLWTPVRRQFAHFVLRPLRTIESPKQRARRMAALPNEYKGMLCVLRLSRVQSDLLLPLLLLRGVEGQAVFTTKLLNFSFNKY